MSEEIEKLKDVGGINRELLEQCAYQCRFGFENITIWHQVTRYEKKEALVKGRKGNKYYDMIDVPVQKTEIDEVETLKAKKNYIKSMNPQKKEEILATISFLSSFLPCDDNDKLDPFFNEVVIKYNSVITNAQQVYSSDVSFIKELEVLKTPFRNTAKVFQSKMNKLQKEQTSSKYKRIGYIVALILSIAVFLTLLGIVWLLLDEFDTALIPIMLDIALIIMYITMKSKFLSFFSFPSWKLIDNLRNMRESNLHNEDEISRYIRMIEMLQA